MFNFPQFDIPLSNKIPTIKGVSIILVSSLLFVVGLFTSFWLKSPDIFAAFGNLISIVALIYAFYAPKKEKDIYTWIENAKREIYDDAELSYQLYGGGDFIRNETKFRNYLEKESPNLEKNTAKFLIKYGNLSNKKFTYQSCINTLQNLRNNEIKILNILKEINNKLYLIELIIGSIGLLINGFGGIIISYFV